MWSSRKQVLKTLTGPQVWLLPALQPPCGHVPATLALRAAMPEWGGHTQGGPSSSCRSSLKPPGCPQATPSLTGLGSWPPYCPVRPGHIFTFTLAVLHYRHLWAPPSSAHLFSTSCPGGSPAHNTAHKLCGATRALGPGRVLADGRGHQPHSQCHLSLVKSTHFFLSP